VLSLNKRLSITIDESNYKRYEELKIQKLSQGKGDLSFASYVNICLANSHFKLEEIIAELKRRGKTLR